MNFAYKQKGGSVVEKFKCMADLQGGIFGVGRIGDVNYWRDVAIEWAKSDGDTGQIEFLRTINNHNLIDYICSVWGLRIEKLRKFKIKEVNKSYYTRRDRK